MSAGLTPYSSHYFNSNDPRFRFTNSSDGQIIIFDTTVNKWVNADPSSISPTLDPNCMVYTDATGTLSTTTLFTFDETTGIVSQDTGYGGLDMRLVKELKFKQNTLKGQPIHLQEQGNSGIIEGVLTDNSNPELMPSVGIAMLDYLTNETGYVVRNGRVVGIVNDASVFDIILATGSLNVGKVIYVNGLGKLTLVRPNGALELVQNIGQIVRVNGSGIDVLVQGAGRTNDVPNTINITGDITCDTLHYNTLDPAINIPTVHDTAITLTAGSYLTGGGVVNLNQATPETITFDVDKASLNIPEPANDTAITLQAGTHINGGGVINLNQATPETVTFDVDKASLNIPEPANDTAITLNAGTHINGGGVINLNQETPETITFNVDKTSLNIPDPANDATITIGSLSPWLTGGGSFTTDQATNASINLSLDTSNAPAPNTIATRDGNGDLSCNTLNYNSLNPPISGSANDATITLNAGTGLSGGGNFTTNQSVNETITFNLTNPVENATITLNAGSGLSGGGNFTTNQSVNETITFNSDIDPANDATITIGSLSPLLTGGGSFTTDQATNATINLSLDTSNAPAPNTIATRDGNGDLSCNALNYNTLVPAIPSPNNTAITFTAGTSLNGGGVINLNQATPETVNFDVDVASLNIPAPANDTAITLNAGSYLTGGGVVNLNQATPETVTFNVDANALYNAIGAYDSTITLATSAGSGLTGGGDFTVDAQDNKTITFGTNATSSATADTLVLRDSSGNFSVNELTYTTLNPPISADITVSDIDTVVVPPVEKWTIQSPAILSYRGFLNDGTGTNLRSSAYNADGSKLITVTFTNTSKEYSLSSPFDITTASLTSQPALNRGSATGIAFTTDGLYYVLVRNVTTDRATLYETATPFSITGSTERLDFDIRNNGGILTPVSATFADNDKLFVADVNGEVSRYTLNRGSNTLSFDSGTNIDIGANHSGIMIKPDGTRFFVVSETSVLSEYELTTPYNIATRVLQATTYNLIDLIPSGDRPSAIVEQDLTISKLLGEDILLTDSGNGRVYQFTLAFPPEPNYTYPIFVSSTSGVQEDLYVDDVLKYETTTKTLEVNTLKYTTLDPPVSSGANDATITLTAGTSLTGGGTFTTDQATNSEITLNVDTASLNIPSPANDTAITFTAGTSLSGGGVINLNQATPETVNFAVDVASLNIPAPANDGTITVTAGTSLTGGGTFTTDQATNGNITLNVDVPSLSIPAPANDGTITVTAGTSLTGGGTFTTDQATNGSITLNVDVPSLNIPAPANDAEITIALSNGLTGGGSFTTNQSSVETINITTNATSDATPDTLVLRDTNGDITVNQLNYTSLNPPVSGGGDLTVVDVDTVPPPPTPEVEKWTIQSPVVVTYVGYYSIGTNLRGATYNNDGSRMYTAENSVNRVRQYALSTPYDVSTAVLEATVTVGTNTRSIDFRPDGTYFATVRNVSSDACVIYECVAGAWDITGAVQRSSYNINTNGGIAGPQSVSWVGGERIFIGDSNGEISTYLFNVGSKTISYVANTNLDTGVNLGGVCFKEDGTKMFKFLQTGGLIEEYDLSVPYSYTNANRTLLPFQFDVLNGVPAQDQPIAIVEWDIKISNALGDNIIISDSGNGRVFQFSLAFPPPPAPLHYTYPIFVNSTSGVQDPIMVDDVLTYETTTKTLEVNTLKYTTLDPPVSGGTAPNDASITITAGTSLTGGGTFTTDQATNETITLNVDVPSLGIPAPASDATITLQAGTGLTGGGAFTTNQSVNETITFNLDAGGATPNDATITLSAGTGLTGGGNFTTNQATNETITFNLDPASVPTVNDTAITFTAGTSLTGGGVINLNQATTETVNFNVDVASLNIPAPANDSTVTITAGTSLTGGGTFTTDQATNGNITLNVDTASLNIPAPANDSTVTITAGSFMTGGGTFTTDQATNSGITLNVDKTSLNIPLGAYDSTITLATSAGSGLTGGGNFTVDASDNKTITFGTNATSSATADTLVLRDTNGDITVNELNYTTLNPPISIPTPTDINVYEDSTTNSFLPIVFASPASFSGVKQLRHNNTDGFGYNPQLAMLVSPTTTISTYLSAPTNNLTTATTSGDGSVCLSSGTGIARSTGLTYNSATNTLSCNVSGTSSGGGGGSGQADTIKVGYDNTDTVAYLTFVNSSSTTTYQQLEMNYSIYADTTTGSIRANKIRNSLGELGFTLLYDSSFSSVGSGGWFTPVNVFTTSFHSYKIIIKTSGTTQGAILQFYFANSLGFVLIDNNYDFGIMLNGGSNTDSNRSYFPISQSIVSNSRTWTVEVHNPTVSNQHTQFYSNNLYQTSSGNYGQNSIHGMYTANVAWFRFGLRTSTGNMTGDMVRVYGY